MTKQRVLLIDDAPTLARVLVQHFRDAGFEAQSANDGDSGLRAFAAQPFDAVVTDILMPQREGFGTIRDMRRHAPDSVIVAVSGCGRIDPATMREVALQSGADDFFAKPFRPGDLIAQIHRLLGVRAGAAA
jgi:DNA-binding response OmpR family regulator